MTTDQDLRDLLSTEADGPGRTPAGWDDIVHRGHHHRRVARARQALITGGVAAVVAVVALSVADRDDTTRQDTVNLPDPATTLPYETTTSTTEAATGTTLDYLYGPGISAARVQGVFVTVLTAPADPPTDFDPCTARHPRVTETADEVLIELVDASLSSGSAWAACQSSAFSGWGTIELADPLGDRRLTDLTTGGPIPAVDGVPLLFPAELPDEVSPDQWDEGYFELEDKPGWSFSFTGDDVSISITTGYIAGLQCESRPLEVRGVTGSICGPAQGVGGFLVTWVEDGVEHQVEMGPVSDNTSAWTIDDVMAVVEGLEPLGG